MHGIHAATSKVENSAQGSSCKLKFVHVVSNNSHKHASLFFDVINDSVFCNISTRLQVSVFLHIFFSPLKLNFHVFWSKNIWSKNIWSTKNWSTDIWPIECMLDTVMTVSFGHSIQVDKSLTACRSIDFRPKDTEPKDRHSFTFRTKKIEFLSIPLKAKFSRTFCWSLYNSEQ